jgi:hypothetical protein
MEEKKMSKEELSDRLASLQIKAQNLAKEIVDLRADLSGSDGPITLDSSNPPPPPPPTPR